MGPHSYIFPYIDKHSIVNLRRLSFVVSNNLLLFDYVVFGGFFFVVVFVCSFQRKLINPGSSLTSSVP